MFDNHGVGRDMYISGASSYMGRSFIWFDNLFHCVLYAKIKNFGLHYLCTHVEIYLFFRFKNKNLLFCVWWLFFHLYGLWDNFTYRQG